MTLIDSRVKLKKKTYIWLKQIKTNAKKKKGSNLKLRQNKRKNNISIKGEIKKKLRQKS
jgi:hypothetical protein